MRSYNLAAKGLGVILDIERGVSPNIQTLGISPVISGQTVIEITGGQISIGSIPINESDLFSDMLQAAKRDDIQSTELNYGFKDVQSGSNDFQRIKIDGMPDNFYLFENQHSGAVYLGFGEGQVNELERCINCGSFSKDFVRTNDSLELLISGNSYRGTVVEDKNCGSRYVATGEVGSYILPFLPLQRTSDGHVMTAEDLKGARYAKTQGGYDVILYDIREGVAGQMIVLDPVFMRNYGNFTTEQKPWGVSVDFFSAYENLNGQVMMPYNEHVMHVVTKVGIDSLPDGLKGNGVAIIDTSASMNSNGKNAMLKQALRNSRGKLERTLDNVTLIYFDRDSSVAYSGPVSGLTDEFVNSIPSNGGSTNILSGLESALEHSKGAGIVLLTDGEPMTGSYNGKGFKSSQAYEELCDKLVSEGARVINVGIIEQGPAADILMAIAGKSNGVYREVLEPSSLFITRGPKAGLYTLEQSIEKMATIGKGEIHYLITGMGKTISGRISMSEVSSGITSAIPLQDYSGKSLEPGNYTITVKLDVPLSQTFNYGERNYSSITTLRSRHLVITSDSKSLTLAPDERLSDYLRVAGAAGVRSGKLGETRSMLNEIVNKSGLSTEAVFNITNLGRMVRD